MMGSMPNPMLLARFWICACMYVNPIRVYQCILLLNGFYKLATYPHLSLLYEFIYNTCLQFWRWGNRSINKICEYMKIPQKRKHFSEVFLNYIKCRYRRGYRTTDSTWWFKYLTYELVYMQKSIHFNTRQ